MAPQIWKSPNCFVFFLEVVQEHGHPTAQAAALLEKAAGDLMRLKLGQLGPRETVLINLEMTMELQNQSGCLEWLGRAEINR